MRFVESLQNPIPVLHAALQVREVLDMAKVAIIVEILPADPDIDLDDLIRRIREKLPEGFELKSFETRPVAFGLSLIKAMFVVPEEEGVSEKLEKTISGFEDVQEVNIVAMTRL